MKIEKINENQIRFVLSREDLDERQVRVSELAYGSAKARELFRDLMDQAAKEVGFEAEDVPLMIEAIPTQSDSLVLLVTKVEDPEEFDARFSNFTPSRGEEQAPQAPSSSADEILSCFEHLENLLSNLESNGNISKKTEKPSDLPDKESISPEVLAEAQQTMARIYAFDSLAVLRKLSIILLPFYTGKNSLYKDEKSGCYYLVLQMTDHTPAEFNKVCNIVAEYGEPARTTYATMSYFKEHFKLILADDAVKSLAKLG